MNGMSKETLLVIISTLSEKVAVMELVNDGYAKVVQGLEAHNDRHHLDLDDAQYTISDLRRQLERVNNDKDDSSYRIRQENDRLYAEVRQLKQENYRLTYGGSSPEETATAYMQRQGAAVWANGERIACIKVCREVSGWGLKETKDFCEAYMDRQKVTEEESPSGTKRSSQIPAGVGVQSKRSA